ncbi:COLI2 protein, partial [Callaeas wilsoni]|nr:COLI2 protein [Callaeas wilsoni]
PAGMGSGILPVALGLLLWNCAGASGACWENSECRDLSSEAGILACLGSCRARLSLEAPLFPGNGQLRPLSASPRGYAMSHFRWNRFGRKNGSAAGPRKREEGAGGDPGIPPSRRPEEREEGAGGDPGIPPSRRPEEREEGAGGDPGIPPSRRPEEREEGAGGDPGIPPSRRPEEREAGKKRSYSMEHFRWGKPVGRKRRPVKVYPNGAEEESAENSPLEFRREAASEEEEEAEKFPWDRSGKEKRYGGFMSSERIRTPLVTLFRNTIGKSLSKEGQ